MGYKLFNLRLPSRLQIVISYILDLIHKSFNVFNKDVITCYQDPFLLVSRLLGNCRALSRILTLVCHLWVWGLRLCASSYVWIFDSWHALSTLRRLWSINILITTLACARACNGTIGLLSLFNIFLFLFFLLSSFVLLLFLVLFIGRKWEVHFHLDLWSSACDGSFQNFISEKHFVDHFIIGSGGHEVLVVDIRVLGRIYSNVLSSPLVLCNCLSNVLLVSHSRCSFHRFNEDWVLLWIVHCKLFYHWM